MRLPFRLASRYIVKRRSGTLVHVISGISVTVIAAVATATASPRHHTRNQLKPRSPRL